MRLLVCLLALGCAEQSSIPPLDATSDAVSDAALDTTLADASVDAVPRDAATDAADPVDAQPRRDQAPPPDAAPPPDPDMGPPPECPPGPDPLGDVRLERQGRYAFAHLRSLHVQGREVVIYLPADYDAAPDRRYPVMYLHDGQNLFDPRHAAFGQAWEVDEAVDDLVGRGIIEPMILVGIANTADRIREYTPSADPEYGGGGARPYGRFLVEELKPFVDNRLRTACGRTDTGLGGSSLGGLVSLWLLGEYPEVFGRVAAISPSLWFNNGEALGWTGHIAARWQAGTRLWLDAGTEEAERAEDGRSSTIRNSRSVFEGLLGFGRRFPEDLGYLEVAGAAHDEAAWRARFPAVLAYLYGSDPGPPDVLEIRLFREPEPAIDVPVSVDAFWRARRLTLPDTTPDWIGPVFAGQLRAGEDQQRITAQWRGREATLLIGPEPRVRVRFRVRVPDGTDGPVYVVGSDPVLGAWELPGLELRDRDDRWEGDAELAAGPFQFKVTRGTWETVEKGPDGEEIPNRDAHTDDDRIEVEVARWADSP